MNNEESDHKPPTEEVEEQPVEKELTEEEKKYVKVAYNCFVCISN